MANTQISQLPAAQPLDGTELVPIVQQGITVRTTTQAIAVSPVLNQSFLTAVQEPTLADSRYLQGNNGITTFDGGPLNPLTVELTGAALEFVNAPAGLIAKPTATTVAARTLLSGGAGLSVINGNGIAGNPVISLAGRNAALESLGGTSGLVVLSGSGLTSVSILGTANQISVANGSGPNNPTIKIADNAVLPGTEGVVVPNGTTSQRPALPSSGELRYNVDLGQFEGYASGNWRVFSQSGSIVSSFSGGVTGLTPVAPASGNVVLGGTLNVGNGGTGVSNLTGYVKGNGTSPFTSSATIPTTDLSGTITNAQLQYSSLTVNGVSISLGGSGSISASSPYSLTVGTGLQLDSGTTYNGSAARTISIDSSVVTLNDSQTLTNKSISGSTNSLSNIGNSSLTNSSVTYNGVAVALGSSGTITASTTNALTAGSGLQFNAGSTFDGSTAKTIEIDSTVATLTGVQTLTNKTISGLTNTLSNIANSSLDNSSVTFNGVAVALGASGTITANTNNALTVGTGLQLSAGTTFNGSAAETISIDSTVATLTGTQSLTNKTISGNNNTLSNIGNSSLTNSSVTINGTSVSLGGSITVSSSTINPATFDNSGAGAVSGTTFNGSSAVTVSYNTIGASPLAGSTSITTLGTITTGVWHGSTIDNLYLTNSSVTIGTTNVALGATASTLAGLTSVTVTQNPINNLDLATKQYVDNIAVQGTYYHAPVKYETASPLTATYNQPGGAGVGVGATLTNSGTLGAFTPDGVIASVGDRILVYRQANQVENGVYTVTTVGDGSTPWVLTRSTDTDTYGLINPNALGQGDAFFVQAGNTGSGETYICNTVGTITFGTTNITFVQISDVQIYTAGTGLTLSGTQFSITNTGVSAATYGSGSTVPTIAVNAQGQITSASNTSIAINGNQITSGTIGSSYISGSYTGITGVGTLTAGTWNANTIDVGYGGTGLSSYTTGDLLYASGTTTLSKLGIGTSNQILTSSGTVPQWTSGSSISVGTATNLAGGAAGSVPYQTGAGATTFLSLGTNGYVLTAGASAPQYTAQSSLSVGSSSNISGGSAGAVPYNTGAGTTTFLSLGTNGYVLTAGGTAPQYVAQSTLSVGSATTATTSTNVAGGAAGSLVYQSAASTTTTLALGTTNYVLTAGASAPQYVAQSTLSVGSATTATNVAGGTTGAVPYQTGAGATTFLSLGTTNYVLTAGASAPQYVAQSTLSVGSATNATNATNTNITVDSTNATNYLTFVSATSGNLPQLVNSSITCNPSTGQITGGIAGGSF